MSQTPLPEKSSEDSKTEQFRFMDLLPEVRDIVYEKLFCPHVSREELREYKEVRRFNLEPAILRTCKLVYEEGSRILYGKKDTFLIQMDEFAHDAITRGGSWFDTPTITQDRSWFDPPIPVIIDGEAGDKAVLTMEIGQYVAKPSKFKRTKKQHFKFIGLLSAIPRVCRLLSFTSGVMDLQLDVHMERPVARSPERRQLILSYCLHYFQEARGLGNAIIFTEPENSDEAARIADLMTTRLDSVAEALRIARAYESRVSKQMKEEKWDEARETLHNALEFFGLLQEQMPFGYLMSSIYGGIGIIEECPLESIMIDMQWKFILCCLEAGQTGAVRYQVRQMFPRYRSMHTPARRGAYQRREADAHCAHGKAYEIDGVPNSAVYSYLQALMCAPGHVEADEAVDHLEERVKSSACPEDLRAKLNIEVILKKFRHQGSGRDPLTKDEAKEVAKGFTATVHQGKKLLYNEQHFHNDLSILEPSSARRLPGDEDYDSEDGYRSQFD